MVYYHVLVERKEKDKKGKYQVLYQYDIENLDWIKNKIFTPYLKNQEFYFQGYTLTKSKIRRLNVKSSPSHIEELVKRKQSQIPPNVLLFVTSSMVVEHNDLVEDITPQLLEELQEKNEIKMNSQNRSGNLKDIFIVHGHNEAMKSVVARFLEKLGLNPIILHEQPNQGKTIIEKLETYANADYAIILYSGCDKGKSAKSKGHPKPRARQNVVFEHGYFTAKLGRDRVAALLEDGVEKPGDLDGVVYIKYNESDWKMDLAKELKRIDETIDLNLIA